MANHLTAPATSLYIGEERRSTSVGGSAKRVFDVVVALLLIVALAPVLVVVALVVAITDPGPILFSHRRLGLNGRYFPCFKFRSMVVDSKAALDRVLETDPAARAEWARDHKLTNDPRISSIGRILRATSLDELPQLFNVVRGEMSLVGPRPIVDEEVPRYGDRFRHYMRARPGMTGLWQVMGRSDCTYRRRVAMDTRYVKTWSFRQDLTILFKTVLVVMVGSGAR